MAIQKELFETVPSENGMVSGRLVRSCSTFSSSSSFKNGNQKQPFPLPSELVHHILSYLGRDSLWDFAASSASCYAISFPLLYSRIALGDGKHRVHFGEYDGVRETNGSHRMERRQLAKVLGWEDCEELRMDLYMLEQSKETLSEAVKAVHFKSPGSSGLLVDKTFELLGAMSNLRCLSLYQPLLAYKCQKIDANGQIRLRTGVHEVLDSLSQLKTLKHLEIDVRPCHIGSNFTTSAVVLPDIPFADVPPSFPSLTSLSIKYKVEFFSTAWSVNIGEHSFFLVALFLTGLLSTSRDTLQELKIDTHAFKLGNDTIPLQPPGSIEACLNFNLGRLIGPQLKVLDYRALNRQGGIDENVDTCPNYTDFAPVCSWFPRLRKLRMEEKYWASDPEHGQKEIFAASPLDIVVARNNLNAVSHLRDLEVLDLFQRRFPPGDTVETQPDYIFFSSLLPSRSPLSNPLPQVASPDWPHSPSDETEFEEEELMLRQILLAQEASRALSFRLPKLRQVLWRANDRLISSRDHFCWFEVACGEVLSAGSPGLRRKDWLSYRYTRKNSEPDNGHLYLVNMFGTRKGSF